MATSFAGLTIEFSGETKGLATALNEIDRSTRKTQTNLNALNRALKFNPGNATLLTQKMHGLASKISETKKRLDVLKTAEQQLGKDKMSTEQWDRLQREIIETEGKLKTLQGQFSRTFRENNAVARAGARIQKLGSDITKSTEGVRNFGDTYSKTVTAGMGAAGAASIKAATDIDTSLTNVRKTVNGTEKQYDQLKKAALDYSKTNAVSATTLMDTEALGAQLGYTLKTMKNGKSEIQEFGEVVSGLDIATNMDAETAGSQLAQFFNIMKLNKSETSNFGSAIVGLGNNFATTESDISNMAMRIAGAGKQIGMSGGDVLGMATALSSLGISAEAGGSAISTILSNLDKSVATNSKSVVTWGSLWARATGNQKMQATDAAEAFKKAWKINSTEAFTNVIAGMEDFKKHGGNLNVLLNALDISELRQTDAMKRLSSNSDLLKRAVASGNDEWQKNTALTNEVGNRNNSLAAKFEILKNRVIAVADEIGEPLADALLDAVDAAEPLFHAIEDGAKSFASMDKEQQQVILRAAAAVAAFGPMLSIVGRVGGAVEGMGKVVEGAGKAFGSLRGVFSGVTTASFGLKAGLAGVAAAVVIGVVAQQVQKWTEYQQKLEDVRKVTEDMPDVEAKAAQSAQAFSGAVDDSAEAQDKAAERISGNLDSLQGKLDSFYSRGASDVDSWSKSWDSIFDKKSKLDYYTGLIEQLSKLGKESGLTKGQMAQLKEAVSEYNSITGDSLKVTDAAKGKLSESTTEINKNKDAWYQQAAAQQYAQQLSEQMKQTQSADENAATAKKNLDDAKKAYDELLKSRGLNKESARAYAASSASAGDDEWNKVVNNLNEAKKQFAETKKAASDAHKEQDELAKSASVSSQKVLASVKANSGLYSKLKEQSLSTADFSDFLSSAGAKGIKKAAEGTQTAWISAFKSISAASKSTKVPVASITKSFKDAGYSAKEMGKVDSHAFETIYKSAHGNLGGVTKTLKTLKKNGKATVTLKTAGGKKVKYEIKQAKDGTVSLNKVTGTTKQRSDNSDAQRKAAQTKSSTRSLNGVTGTTKQNANNSNALAKTRQTRSDTQSLNGNVATVFINAAGNALSTVRSIWDGIQNFAGQTFNFFTHSEKKATGAYVHGQTIPRHAEGYYLATSATVTNQGLVGEAGAEFVANHGNSSWVIPTQNSRYFAPLSNRIVSDVVTAIGGHTQSNVYQIKLEYRAGDDANKMARELADAIRMQRRLNG